MDPFPLSCWIYLDATPTSNLQPIRWSDPDCWYKFKYWMANSADSEKLASSEANWSGSTLFAKIYTVCKGRAYTGSAGQGLTTEITNDNSNEKSSIKIFSLVKEIYYSFINKFNDTGSKVFNFQAFKQKHQQSSLVFCFSSTMFFCLFVCFLLLLLLYFYVTFSFIFVHTYMGCTMWKCAFNLL